MRPGASNLLKFIYTFTHLRKGNYMTWKLLLIDDEPCILDALAEWLTDDEIAVTKATNGLEGLELMEDNEFDLVISDISMPVMDGATMFREARASGNFTPHIFFSASGDLKLFSDLKDAGAVAVIQKPHFEKLSSEINSVLVKNAFMHRGSEVYSPLTVI